MSDRADRYNWDDIAVEEPKGDDGKKPEAKAGDEPAKPAAAAPPPSA